MINFKQELVQLLGLPSNSSNSDVYAACLVALTVKKKTKSKSTANK